MAAVLERRRTSKWPTVIGAFETEHPGVALWGSCLGCVRTLIGRHGLILREEEEFLKVVITTSGVGSRLGEYTEFTNKSLVGVGDKPVLGHIIDAYPDDYEFVVTIGYRGDLVEQFLELAYPSRSFQIVPVDAFDGPGSSLGYSMLSARTFLQEPFIYNAGDTLWTSSETLAVSGDWVGGFAEGDSSLYASFDVTGDRVAMFHPKGMIRADFLYVGLAGIHSYETFWDTLSRVWHEDPISPELNDVSAIDLMVAGGAVFRPRVIDTWYDVGSVAGLQVARSAFKKKLPTLEKRDESIFYADGVVLKFFADEEVARARVERAGLLSPSVPSIRAFTKNWYSYDFVEGQVLGDKVTPQVFEGLLGWGQSSFWGKKPEALDAEEFSDNCQRFYIDKSRKRIDEHLKRSGLEDKNSKINGVNVPSAGALLQLLEESNLVQGRAGVMHGDFILDNILQTNEGFVAIDWRQGFGELLAYGDIYYDLAKLNHSLTMNHGVLGDGNFEVAFSSEGNWVDVFRKSSLIDCEKELESFATVQGYDMGRIRILTALIWINMAPLHEHPMDAFLYNFGRYSLWKNLVSQGITT